MTPKEKVYHIYAKDKCIFHSLKEDDFNIKWDTLNHLVGLMKTEYTKEDLSFIELPPRINGAGGKSSEPPGCDSY
jgi:hypothetical protein